MKKVIKLSEWAKEEGISYAYAHTLYKKGKIDNAFKSESGSIFVNTYLNSSSQEGNMSEKEIKLSEWAKLQGVGYIHAHNLFKKGKIKNSFQNKETNSIFVRIDTTEVVKKDPDRTLKLSAWAKQKDFTYRGALRLFKQDKISGAYKTETGSIVVKASEGFTEEELNLKDLVSKLNIDLIEKAILWYNNFSIRELTDVGNYWSDLEDKKMELTTDQQIYVDALKKTLISKDEERKELVDQLSLVRSLNKYK